MAMKKRFYTVDGQMVGYEEGGVRKDFLTDHLGSIIAIMDENEVRVFDTRYSAYGRNRWITGTGCGFGWVGSFGYRETGLFHMSHYVRARHYSYITGGWSTVDPLWPRQPGYIYVKGHASTDIDPIGLGDPWDSPACDKARDAMRNALSKCFDPAMAAMMAEIMRCIAYGESGCNPRDVSPGVNGKAYGLYQLGDKEIDRCHLPECCKADAQSQIGCNTLATVDLIARLFGNSGFGSSIGDKLCRYFGTLPCKEVGRGKPEGENAMKCLKAKGINPFKIPAPKPKPGCSPCKPKPKPKPKPSPPEACEEQC